MSKLQKFENLMKDVQQNYADEFADMNEITSRFHLLSSTHEILKKRHEGSETAVDGITGQLDEFHKVTGTKSLEFANLIAEEQKKL